MRDGIPARRRRLAGEAVARQRRDHDMERVRCGSAMRGRIGQRLDDLHLLDDRAGPAMRDDHRQRVVVLRADVNEVDVQPVDLGDEVRQGVEPRLHLAPVVVRRPILRELLHRRELHALRIVRDGLLVRPAGRRDAPAQIVELILGRGKLEGSELGYRTGRCERFGKHPDCTGGRRDCKQCSTGDFLLYSGHGVLLARALFDEEEIRTEGVLQQLHQGMADTFVSGGSPACSTVVRRWTGSELPERGRFQLFIARLP